MRFLHTSDWHVGRTMRRRPRTEEFAAVLQQVTDIAEAEAVDAVLVAGDVYDQMSPAPDADDLVFDAFLRLHAAGIPAVVIPGNHESPKRWESLGKLLSRLGVQVVPRVVPPSLGGVVEVASRDGAETAVVACIPFVPERRFATAAELFEAPEEGYQSYAEGMSRLIGQMAAGFRTDAVNIVMAHLFTDGALVTPGGGERELHIGMTYAIPPSRFPVDASYIALGHVHKPQAVKGASSPTRYAGSLLQLDFGESTQKKSVAIVEAVAGKPSKIREVPIDAGRALRNLRGTMDQVEQLAGTTGDAYLRVYVQTDGPSPGIAERVFELFPHAVAVHLEYERGLADTLVAATSSMQPREQFELYFHSEHGTAPSAPLLDAFDALLAGELEEA